LHDKLVGLARHRVVEEQPPRGRTSGSHALHAHPPQRALSVCGPAHPAGQGWPAALQDDLAGGGGQSPRAGASPLALADLPPTAFFNEADGPYETDEVTDLIVDTHDTASFARIVHLPVGGLRDALLAEAIDPSETAAEVTPEMAAAVRKLCREQEQMQIARCCEVVTQFSGTISLRVRLLGSEVPWSP
jgi:ethanolamine ammonia-lyase large subunit